MNKLTPEARYLKDIESGYSKDPSQKKVIASLQNIYVAYMASQKNRFLTRRNKKPGQGLYLWGPVGTGKTYLMDTFYNALPEKGSLRMHFHQFMEYVHIELTRYQGRKNPLKIIAKNIAKNARILCFDEFVVIDIADAMLLAGLLEVLFEQGVILIATSNVVPDKLYENGLQRNKFLPAIALLNKYCEVLAMTTQVDYRLRHTVEESAYFHPLNKKSEKLMQTCFDRYAKGNVEFKEKIKVLGRKIQTIAVTDQTLFIEFKKICGIPRSQRDYLELVKQYDTFLVSSLPQLKKRAHPCLI
jgi:cell division protein ZapE